MKYIVFIFVIILFTACSTKQAKISNSAVIIFKTPSMKFYDKGFVKIYDEYINLQIYNSGVVALNLDIYEDKVCTGTFKCMDATVFNESYLSSSYAPEFLYKLFSQKKVYFKDHANNIFIKVKKL